MSVALIRLAVAGPLVSFSCLPWPRERELPRLPCVLGPFFAYVRLSARENLRR